MQNYQYFVWDKLVRCTHWLVAVIIVANLFFTQRGSVVHQYAGYAAVMFVVIRLLWACLGAQRPARFRDLIPTPKGFYLHLQELRTRQLVTGPGHNAFGLLAIWSMWGCTLALGASGYLMGTEWGIMNDIGDWHGWIARVLKMLVFLHVIAVIMTTWWLKYNLLKPMIHR